VLLAQVLGRKTVPDERLEAGQLAVLHFKKRAAAFRAGERDMFALG
jgi:hypothetical protein